MARVQQEITIEIDEEGNTTIEAHGYKDGACLAATQELEEALGQVTDREMKDREMRSLRRGASRETKVKAR